MKKPSFWAGVIGAITIIVFTISGAKSLINPTNLVKVNIAQGAINLTWVFFGVFLVLIYLRSKSRDDSGIEQVKFIPDSPEDIESLNRKRNWILGFFILVGSIGSLENWILNDYTAGLALVNIIVIFDLLMTLILVYLSIGLFRNREKFVNITCYFFVAYAFLMGCFDLMRGRWFGSVGMLLVIIYFILATKLPINRKNYRILHLIILPFIIVFMIAFSGFDDKKITDLSKKESLVEQEFFSQTDKINTAYSFFLQRGFSSKVEIQDLKDLVEKRDKKIQEIFSNMNSLNGEYLKQLPNIPQKKILEHYRFFLVNIEIDKEQTDKLKELISYSENLDFKNLTEKQILMLSSLNKEIDEYNSKIIKNQFEWDNANLNL